MCGNNSSCRNGTAMPKILTKDDVHKIELCGKCVKQPQLIDFLSNPKKHAIIEFICHRNSQLGDKAASDIIVLYTPEKKHQALEIQQLFEIYGFDNVIVVPEYLLFVDNSKRILKTTTMLILDVFESTLNMHVIDESRQYKNICAHDIYIRAGVIHTLLTDICMGYYSNGKEYMRGNDIVELKQQLEKHFTDPYASQKKWELEWVGDQQKKEKIIFDKDPWESAYIKKLPDCLNPWLNEYKMKLEDIQRVMVVGYSATAENVVNAALSVFSKAYPVQPDSNQFLLSTLWEIVHHPECYAFLSNRQMILSAFSSFRPRFWNADYISFIPPSPNYKCGSHGTKRVEESMHWKKMETQSHSSQLVTKYEDPFVFVFLYGNKPVSMGISMVLNQSCHGFTCFHGFHGFSRFSSSFHISQNIV